MSNYEKLCPIPVEWRGELKGNDVILIIQNGCHDLITPDVLRAQGADIYDPDLLLYNVRVEAALPGLEG